MRTVPNEDARNKFYERLIGLSSLSDAKAAATLREEGFYVPCGCCKITSRIIAAIRRDLCGWIESESLQISIERHQKLMKKMKYDWQDVACAILAQHVAPTAKATLLKTIIP